MNIDNATKQWLRKSKAPRRRKPYKYKQGSLVVNTMARKLCSQYEIELCAALAKAITIKQIAQVMDCSPQVVSRAIRAYHYMVMS